MTTQSPLTTLGEIRFSHCGEHSYPLFRVNADVPINDALEHASTLLHLAKQFSHGTAVRPLCLGGTLPGRDGQGTDGRRARHALCMT